MEHWQVLKLMVAGFWSEIAQDEICQKRMVLCSRKKRSYLNRDLFGGSLPFGS
jgi:hypothetical protein